MIGIVILDFYSKRLSELRSIYILPAYRSNGIGKRLVAALVKKAKNRGVKQLLTLTLKDKKNWFAKSGFNEEAHGFKVPLFKEL